MGKTLLLSMLEQYYDVLAAPAFDELFGGLEIARAPTEERGRYAVLRLEMTGMPTTQGVNELRAVFHDRLHNKIQEFLDRYRELLPEVVAAFEAGRSTDDPASLMNRFLVAMSRSPHPLYLLIDEYDNFTNDLIARGDHKTYRDIVHASGFVREFYKTVNISLHKDFNAFAGFTAEDVRRLVAGVLAEGGYALDPATVEEDLRLYYDGYLFSRDASERMFNPDTAQRAMARDGDIAPFLEMVFTRALRKLSNRDLIRLDEKTMKVAGSGSSGRARVGSASAGARPRSASSPHRAACLAAMRALERS